MSLDIDVQPLFDNMQIWIPVMFGIFAIPAGIRLAIGVVQMIVNKFSDAFK